MPTYPGLTHIVVARGTTAPPVVANSDIGRKWLVGASATGAWVGWDNSVAELLSIAGGDIWLEHVPQTGDELALESTPAAIEWHNGSTWIEQLNGPGSSIDNTLPRWNGTGGADLQSSGVVVDDSDAITGVASINGAVVEDSIHVNIAGELAAITLKASPTTLDVLLIEDNADSNNKKRIPIGNLDGLLDHDALSNYVLAQHRVINDSGTAATELWSADKLTTELATKAGALAELSDVSAAASTGNFVLATSAGVGGSYLGRLLVIGDIPEIPLTQLADIADDTMLGNVTGGLAAPVALTGTQIRTLLGIEAGATADQSDAEIETAYNTQVAAASQAEMEAGTATAIRRVSPLRVKNAIRGHEKTKTIVVEAGTASEDIGLGVLSRLSAVTITAIRLVLASGTSWTWQIRHHTDRSNAGNALLTTPEATTSTTVGSTTTTFADGTAIANSWFWLETTAQAGDPQGELVICYTEDN